MDDSSTSYTHRNHGAEENVTVLMDSHNNCSPSSVDNFPSEPINGEVKAKSLNKCKKKNLIKKKVDLNVPELPSTSSSSPRCSSSGVSVARKRRNPRILVRRTKGDVSAIGHPLGMSFAAVIAQVRFSNFFFFFVYNRIYSSLSVLES